jgi:hypothetical protein
MPETDDPRHRTGRSGSQVSVSGPRCQRAMAPSSLRHADSLRTPPRSLPGSSRRAGSTRLPVASGRERTPGRRGALAFPPLLAALSSPPVGASQTAHRARAQRRFETAFPTRPRAVRGPRHERAIPSRSPRLHRSRVVDCRQDRLVSRTRPHEQDPNDQENRLALSDFHDPQSVRTPADKRETRSSSIVQHAFVAQFPTTTAAFSKSIINTVGTRA